MPGLVNLQRACVGVLHGEGHPDGNAQVLGLFAHVRKLLSIALVFQAAPGAAVVVQQLLAFPGQPGVVARLVGLALHLSFLPKSPEVVCAFS